jgi:hypothetical protein
LANVFTYGDAKQTTPHVADAVHLLKAVFSEIPGTRLTVQQVTRLSGLDQAMCEVVLGALEDTRFLRRGTDGRYQRRSGDSPYS